VKKSLVKGRKRIDDILLNYKKRSFLGRNNRNKLEPILTKIFKHQFKFFLTLATVVVLILFLGILPYRSGADVASFHPSTCAGGWENPSNTIGEPSLPEGASLENFTKNNSAFMSGNSELDCSNFQGEIPNDSVPKKFTLSLSWSVDNNSIIHDDSKPAIEDDALLAPSAVDGSDQIGNSIPVPDTASPTIDNQTSPSSSDQNGTPDISAPTIPDTQIVPVAPDQNLDSTSTNTSNTDTAPSTDANNNDNTNIPAPATDNSSAPANSSDSPQSLLENLFSLKKVFADDSSVPTDSISASANTTTNTDTSATDSFMEVFYTLDGNNWNSLGTVTMNNWQNVSFNVPLSKWDDISQLQVSLRPVQSIDTPPAVYVDAINLNIDYGPLEDLLNPPTVLLKDSSSIISGKDDFNSSEPAVFTITNPNLDVDAIKNLVKENKAEVLEDDQGLLGNPVIKDGSPTDQVDKAVDYVKQATDAVNSTLDSSNGSVIPTILPTTTDDSNVPSSTVITPEQNSAPEENDNSNSASPVSFKKILEDISLGPKTAQADSDSDAQEITAVVLDNSHNPTDIATSMKTVDVNGTPEQQIEVEKPAREFHPGKYTLQITLNTPQAIIVSEQDFTWGVLAINVDKSVYESGNDAYIQMGVLNDEGFTICNAGLDLYIKDPTGSVTHFSTDDDSIIREKECGPNNVIAVPDYYTHFSVPDIAGTYNMVLTASTANGLKTITDSFDVISSSPFVVQRSGPTRIYPIATYPMTIRVTSKTDWVGTLTEEVPASFEITEPDVATTYDNVETDGDTKIISWNVSLPAGQEEVLGYNFNAPDISPEFYLLGPVKLTDTNGDVSFSESRSWQIASDAAFTATSRATGNWETGSTWSTTSTGTITTTTSSATVNGVSTLFTTEAPAGTVIMSATNQAIGTVLSVTSNTQLTLTTTATTAVTTNAYTRQVVPASGDAAVLASGFTVTVTSTDSVASVNLSSPASTNGLIINNGAALTVSGALTFAANATVNNETVTLGSAAGGAGNLTVGSIVTSAAASTGATQIVCYSSATETGTLTVNGTTASAVSLSGSTVTSSKGGTIDLSGGGCNLKMNGTGGGITFTIPASDVGVPTVKMGTGTASLNTGGLTFTSGSGQTSKCAFNMGSGGTLILNGTSLPVVGNCGVYTFTSTNLTSTGTSTVAYATAVTWGALSVSSGTLKLSGAAETFSSVSVSSGTTLQLAGFAFTNNGITTVGGSVICTAAATCTGLKTFTGAVEIQSGGALNFTIGSPTTAPTTSFGANITMDSGASSFNTNNLTTTFTASSIVSGGVAVTLGAVALSSGVTLTNNINTSAILTMTSLTFPAAPASPVVLTLSDQTHTTIGAIAYAVGAGSSNESILMNGNANLNATSISMPALSGTGSALLTCVSSCSGTLAVSAAVTITGNTTTTGLSTIAMDTANMTVGGLLTISGGAAAASTLSFSTGNLTLSAGITFSGTVNKSILTVTGLNNTINFAGNWTNTVAPTLTVDGSTTLKTSGATTTLMSSATTWPGNLEVVSGVTSFAAVATTIQGTVKVDAGTLKLVGAAVTINGNTDITGSINCPAGATCTGLKTFAGKVTIESGGSFDLATGAPTVAPTTSFAKDITMATGASTFNTNTGATTFAASLALVGTVNMTFGGASTINNTFTVTNNNTATVTFSSNLLGGGTSASFATGSGSTTDLGGTVMTSGTFIPSTSANTVEYTGGTQSVVVPTTNPYYNLNIKAAGVKSLAGITTVSGTTNISAGSLDTTSTNHYAFNTKNLTIGASGTFLGEASTITVTGNWSNSGTFTAGTSTVLMNGSATTTVSGTTTFNNLTITNTTAKEVDFQTSSTPIFTISGILNITGHLNKLITIRSDSPGVKWIVYPIGTTNVDYVDVKDGGCQVGSKQILPGDFTDSGNNDWCWLPVSITFSNSDSSIGFGALASNSVTYANGAGTGSILDTIAHTFNIQTTAKSGYSLSYVGPTLTSGSNTILACMDLGTGGTPGLSQFAMSGNLTGTNTGAMQSDYNYATPLWSYSTGGSHVLASSSGPVSADTIDMHYEANILPTTPAGSYTTTITYILTGNF